MFDGTYVRLPNSDVFLSEIRNYSGAAARRIELVFGVAYKEDLAKVIATITETVTGTPLVLVEPVPDIYVDKVGDSAILVNVWCWAPYSVWFDLKKQLVQQIKEALDRAGIKIPLPQRVVHVMHDKRQDAENVDSRNASMSSMAGSG